MYNEKIEQLIKAALADGVLTEKEKQVLFKRAQEQGIDLDEFEMVLDARLQELQKAEKEQRERAAQKSNKFGEVRKCPSCEETIPLLVGVCPYCGHLFEVDRTDIKAVAEIDQLVQKLVMVKPNNKPIAHTVTIITLASIVFAALGGWYVKSQHVSLWELLALCSWIIIMLAYMFCSEPMAGSPAAKEEAAILPSMFKKYYYEIQSKIKAAKNIYAKNPTISQRLAELEATANDCANERKDRSKKIIMVGGIISIVMILVGLVIHAL